MEKQNNEQLKKIALLLRRDVISMLVEAGSGHSAGPLGLADVFSALYFNILNHDSQDPKWDGRDVFILSAGHLCPILYATLARSGYFPVEELKTLRKINSRLQGHPNRLDLPGLENSSGPLAQGFSQAIGIALAMRLDQKQNHVFCLTGDGELNEGQIWEALMFSGKERLHNLTLIVDRNNIQIDGFTEDVMPLEPLRDKFEAFNWHVIDVNGHDISAFISACEEAKIISERPTVLITHTIPGKGVSFMENKFEWHGKPPNKEEALRALAELV